MRRRGAFACAVLSAALCVVLAQDSWPEEITTRWATPPEAILREALRARIAILRRGVSEVGPDFQWTVQEMDPENRRKKELAMEQPGFKALGVGYLVVEPATVDPERPPLLNRDEQPVSARLTGAEDVVKGLASHAWLARSEHEARQILFHLSPGGDWLCIDLYRAHLGDWQYWTSEKLARALRLERGYFLPLRTADEYLVAISALTRIKTQQTSSPWNPPEDDTAYLAEERQSLTVFAHREAREMLALVQLSGAAAITLMMLAAAMMMWREWTGAEKGQVPARWLGLAAALVGLSIPCWVAAYQPLWLLTACANVTDAASVEEIVVRQLEAAPPSLDHPLMRWNEEKQRWDLTLRRKPEVEWEVFIQKTHDEDLAHFQTHPHKLDANALGSFREMNEAPGEWVRTLVDMAIAQDQSVQVEVHMDRARRLFGVIVGQAPYAPPSNNHPRSFTIVGAVLVPVVTASYRGEALQLLRTVNLLGGGRKQEEAGARFDAVLAISLDPIPSIKKRLTLAGLLASLLNLAALLAWFLHMRATRRVIHARAPGAATTLEAAILSLLPIAAQRSRLDALAELHEHRVRMAADQESERVRRQRIDERRSRQLLVRAPAPEPSAEPSLREIAAEAETLRARVLNDPEIEGALRQQIVEALEGVATARNARRALRFLEHARSLAEAE